MASNFQSMTSKSLGNLISYSEHASGVEGHTSHGIFNVSIYTDSIVRVTATLKDTFENFSYTVVSKPGKGNFEIIEQDDMIKIRTKAFVLAISKNPVRFSFQDFHGRIINEDDSFGTSWIGEQVTTYKKLQPHERFIGLGEKTGPLDRRGAAYENWNSDAYAYNTGTDPLYSSMPFYIGVHHPFTYGIFLDNTHHFSISVHQTIALPVFLPMPEK
jgi:alpha-glucosidase